MERFAQPVHPSRDEEASCLGKQQYPSENASRAGMEFFQHAGVMRTGDGIGPYKCCYCPFWHLGH